MTRSTPSLPVRSLSDSRLVDVFHGPGCPVCRIVRRDTDGFLASLLWENVNDVGIRARLDAQRGLCPVHVRAIVAADRKQAGGTLGSGILLGAMLRVRRMELSDASTGRGRKRALARARRPADCMACTEAARMLGVTLGALARLAGDEAWMDALGTAELCLDHLLALLADLPDGPAATLHARQSARITALADRVEAFTQHSSHDRRHLLTPEELGATDEVVELLGDHP